MEKTLQDKQFEALNVWVSKKVKHEDLEHDHDPEDENCGAENDYSDFDEYEPR